MLSYLVCGDDKLREPAKSFKQAKQLKNKYFQSGKYEIVYIVCLDNGKRGKGDWV